MGASFLEEEAKGFQELEEEVSFLVLEGVASFQELEVRELVEVA